MSNSRKKSCCSASRQDVGQESSVLENVHQTIQKSSIGSLVDMVYISGDDFLMGTNDQEGFPADGEVPIRKIEVDSFYIDMTTVTNEEFAQFIKETGYKTDAEKYGWSFVFYKLISKETAQQVKQQVHSTPWWWV